VIPVELREDPSEGGEEEEAEEKEPENAGEGADEGHVGNASMAKEVAVRAEGECEEPFEGKEADVARQIKVGMEKKCAVNEGDGEREGVVRCGENCVFKGGERERKPEK
jgi:ribosomal protein S17